MGYGAYLAGLLAPLGVYDLSEQSRSGACVAALGAAMDEIDQSLTEGLREAFPQMAQDAGLRLWEQTLALTPQADPDARRRAIRTLVYGGGGVSCSARDISLMLQDCGVSVQLTMDADKKTVLVGCASIPPEGSAQRALIERLLPAHLAVEYRVLE